MLNRRVLTPLLFVAFIFAAEPAAAKTPSTITYQGYLRDRSTGKPVTGQPKATLKIFDAASGGTEKWKEEHPSINLSGGYFEAILGLTAPLTGVFDGSDLYMEISIGGETLLPRKKITSVPYALVAENATGDITPKSVSVGGKQVIDSSGSWLGTLKESDPQVGSNKTKYVSVWNGSALVSGSIYDNGNVGIGTTSPNGALDIKNRIELDSTGYFAQMRIRVGTAKSTARLYIDGLDGSVNPTNQAWYFRDSNKQTKIYFNTAGVSWFDSGNFGLGTSNPTCQLDVGSGCYKGTPCSDIRMKRNIESLPSNVSALAKVMKLRAVSFEWRDQEDRKKHIGLISQEVEKIIPELVPTQDIDIGQKGISYTGLSAVLVEAVKEQQAVIGAQERKIKNLKKKLASQDKRLRNLEAVIGL